MKYLLKSNVFNPGGEKGKRRKYGYFAFLLSFALILFSCMFTTVHAESFDLKDALDMSFEMEERFDDNIFDTWDEEKRFDFITVLRPDLSFDLQRGGLLPLINDQKGPSDVGLVPALSVSMGFELEYYVLNPELDSQNSDGLAAFEPKIDISLEPDEGLSLSYSFDRGRYSIAEIDPLGSSEERKKVDSTTHRFGLDLDFGPSRDIWNFSYNRTMTDNDGEDSLDRTTDNWKVDINLNDPPSRLPRIFFQYDGSRTGGGAASDKVTHNLFMGLKGRFSPKISGTVKTGTGVSIPSGDLFELDDADISYVIDMDFNYAVTDRVSMNLGIRRALEDIVSSPGSENDNSDGTGDGLNIPRSTDNSWDLSGSVTYTPPFFSEDLVLGGSASHREIEYTDGSTQTVQTLGLTYDYSWPRTETDGIIFLSDLSLSGQVRTRRTSPETAWSRFSDNEVFITLKWEL